MQKEALVRNGVTGITWRFVSDEGPYLDGFDEGPCPLSFLTTGMVSMFADAIVDAARARSLDPAGMVLTLDNRYTMDGSARAGTMTGGALSPSLAVEETDLPRSLIEDAVSSSAVMALVGGVHESLFSLSVNGEPVSTGRVSSVGQVSVADPAPAFAHLTPMAGDFDDVIIRQVVADQLDDVAGGVNTSLAENQSRMLHVRGVCTVRADGVKEIVQNLYQPIGSQFRFLSQETPSDGSPVVAPDAASYVAGGIAFCFMTQLGRYARIVKGDLPDYRIVQDLFLGDEPIADPVETHVYLNTEDGTDFGRLALDMSEQTCFLHALCRTDLDLDLREPPD